LKHSIATILASRVDNIFHVAPGGLITEKLVGAMPLAAIEKNKPI
jgi:hypothetical protein